MPLRTLLTAKQFCAGEEAIQAVVDGSRYPASLG